MSSIINSIKEFFSNKFNVYLIIILLLIGLSAFFLTGTKTTTTESDELAINYFYMPTCPHCTEQRPIILELEQEYSEIKFYYHDASTPDGSSLFYKMATEAGLETSRLGVPATFVGKKPLIGTHSKEQIIAAIQDCQEKCEEQTTPTEQQQDIKESYKEFKLPFIGEKDLTSYSLPVLAIILGLIDGFNPCAMWVLVFLIGILIGLRDKKKIWIIVGSFVLASGILYFLFMTAWLNVFLLIGYVKIITIIIGLIALGGGILSLKDYIVNKGAIECKVGDAGSKKKTMTRIKEIVAKPLSIGIIISIIGLAFVVNSVEFMCSAAIPAVFTQILALSGITALQQYMYIALYVFFFMLDDLIIFGLAAFAVSSSLGEKYAKYTKLIGGIIMVILGAILVFAPHLLR